ncbi:ferredoxin-type protein NapG [Candidatus Venteria ishoeyi]|uniref:Quinol dehydrogenase periplasmic component n=1 Tax=Candidatus Venteria ishoeyi TaxID=1899563 RepID=A0A1H6F6S9_9GAMM|nr:ferredoxin-type protein NapG [Candidatus Venteria ishoeyi]MDM8545202.1 ferredoxin-type protein NapG [Candidatus Venteria ishoeyi]SEH04695.1 quinol dehydrogenase periplasmic component [Candidatus Venteria ishoeyi]
MSDQNRNKVKGDSQQTTRRQFLVDSARTACGVGLLGLGIGVYSQRAGALPANALRPPGALPEMDFLAACTRCGLCVRDCPYDMLHLAKMGDDLPMGTPYFYAREAGCEMCEDIPCIPVCPTGALSHELTDINEARMGLAVVSDEETCIAFLGLRCEVCFNICPIRGKAITLEKRHNERSGKHALFIPVVHSDACTGCGKCEEVCILEESAIRVLPNPLVQGELGSHYRKGWEEKSKAGQALVTPDTEHRYNLPEGVRYEHDGEGLIIDDAESPDPNSAIDALNRGLGE